MARQLAPTPLAEWLHEQILERGWGIRTLARKMTQPGEDPEVARRCLNRAIFEGSDPKPENRARIAAALGVAESEVPALHSRFPEPAGA